MYACMAALSAGIHTYAAADTLKLSLPQLEKRFIDSNLLLLAAHFNTDAQKALVDQARKWDNPTLNTDQAIAANGRFFPYGKNPDGSYGGQYYIQIEQLIKTAGKRSKLINLATTNVRLSELQLQDMLRTLRYELRTDYYQLLYQLATRSIYNNQAEQLDRLLSGMQAQLTAGNIAQKDLLRIQGLSVSLQQDIAELDRAIAGTQSAIRMLLHIRGDVFIRPVDSLAGDHLAQLIEPARAFQEARQNNPAFLFLQTQITYQEQNLAYQKALRVPDITVGPNFDRNSNFAPNYAGLSVSLPIPLFDKNRGNIRSAAALVKQQQALTDHAGTELQNNLQEALDKLYLAVRQDNAEQRNFYSKYRDMYVNVLQSYQRRQIGLLEFLDFFTDYTASQQRLLLQQLNLKLAIEELNYHAGTDIIK